MTNEELRKLMEKQEAQLARGEAILQRAMELIKEHWRLSLPFAYEALDEDLAKIIKGREE